MYKIYISGQEFMAENGDILAKYPLETVFFELNAKSIVETDNNDFLVKLQADDRLLLAVHHADYPMVIFGDNGLCIEFAKIAAEQKLTFPKVLGTLDTCEAFLKEYVGLTNCTYAINHAMDIMQCRKVLTDCVDGVEQATKNDVDELTCLHINFAREALGDNLQIDEVKKTISSGISNFRVIRCDGKIVSYATLKRETDVLACVTDVYTLPQYRCQGLSRKIVTSLTRQVVESGRLAYLFVDKTNPISNHLYQKIGYTYAVPQYEMKLTFNS